MKGSRVVAVRVRWHLRQSSLRCILILNHRGRCAVGTHTSRSQAGSREMILLSSMCSLGIPQVPKELTARDCSSAEGRCPSPAVGYALIAGSTLFLVLGSYAVFFSAFLPLTGIWVRVRPLDAAPG